MQRPEPSSQDLEAHPRRRSPLGACGLPSEPGARGQRRRRRLPWDTPLTTLQDRHHRPGRLHHLAARHGRVRRGAGVRRRDQRVHPPPHHGGARGRLPRRRHQPRLGAGHYRGHRVSLRRTPFFRVLHRPRLFLGGEREPTLMMAIVAAGLAVSGQNLVTLAVAAVSSGSAASASSAQVAKADPQMSRVYLRQLKYRGYYPPRSRPYRERRSRPGLHIGLAVDGRAPDWMSDRCSPSSTSGTRRPASADLLNWAALFEDGIVQCKDGSFLAGWYFQGPDIQSSTDSERDWLTARVNAALSRLGAGWATWTEAIRTPAASYPPAELSHFPDPVSRLVDDERRRQFMREGVHFESRYVLVIQYTPPLRRKSKVADLIYDDDPAERQSPADRILQAFRKAIGRLRGRHRRRGAARTDADLRRHRPAWPRASARRAGQLPAFRPDRRGARAEHPAGRRLPRCRARRPGALGRRHAQARGPVHRLRGDRGLPDGVLAADPGLRSITWRSRIAGRRG